MKFKLLQDNLRKMLWERIEAGDLTGLRLAQQTSFKQAHISNFLNKKRGLSLEGMDKVLLVQQLSVLDLLDPAEVSKRATILPPSNDEFENVLLVDTAAAATEPMVVNMHVQDILKFKKTFLDKLRPEIAGKDKREDWQRFVLIKIDAEDAPNMSPRLMPGAMLLLDRRYNSLKPYREGEANLYAVLKRNTCVIRYVEAVKDHLILRGHNSAAPLEILSIADDMRASDYLIGRVCHISQQA
jgi:hypothetical protein